MIWDGGYLRGKLFQGGTLRIYGIEVKVWCSGASISEI